MQKHAQSDLVNCFLEPIVRCAEYTPKFGRSEGVNLSDFDRLYGSDRFYSLIGLNTPAVYAAHRAAGGLTSIYRQIGIGSERLLRKIIIDRCGLSETGINWSYTYSQGKKEGIHKLDARVRLHDLSGSAATQVENWLESVGGSISTGQDRSLDLDGVVFEIRQGYKSADSKRQNADLRFAARAYQDGLMPVVLVMSNQIADAIVDRYRRDGLLVTTGITSEDPYLSSFALVRALFDFDLEEFFEDHRETISKCVRTTVTSLLSAEQ